MTTTPTATYSDETIERYSGEAGALTEAAEDRFLKTTKAYLGSLEGGFHAKPYRVKNDDGSYGNLTIGHGFEYIDGKPITADMTITEEESNRILENYINQIDSYFNEKYPAYGNLPVNAQGALVSFAYNNGMYVVDQPKNKILRKAMLEGNMDKIANAMSLYTKGSNGKFSKGLDNRRKDEIQMFLNNSNRGFSYED